MNSKKLLFFLIPIILTNCSFDNKTGIWKGDKDVTKRVLELEKKQKEIVSTNKIFSSEIIYNEEKKLSNIINLSIPKNISSWSMSGLNIQNLLGNMYLTGADNIFLKKGIGKNKSSISKITNSPLFYKDNLILSDNRGTIYKITQNGKVIWKRNIYKKIYKKIYKNLTIAIYKNNIFVSDNIGFIYKISFLNGKIVWIKNHGIPLKSKIKVINDKIFLTNQDNRFLAFSTDDGSVIWNVRAVSSFIKVQNLLSTAGTDDGYVVSSNTSGDLLKVNSQTGNVMWSINALSSTLAHATDFFKSSNITIVNEFVIFSTQSSIFSFDLKSGYINWETNVSFVTTPIIDKKNIFLVTENGYFVIMNLDNGKIISSTNILKILKKKKQQTKVAGFIMGSGKIYITTLNGYLITSSALTGKAEDYKKISSSITSSPIISNGKLFIYTQDSKIIGLN